MLELLGNQGGDGMFDWTANPDGEIIRPVYGMHIDIQNGIATACSTDDDPAALPATCQSSSEWLSAHATAYPGSVHRAPVRS